MLRLANGKLRNMPLPAEILAELARLPAEISARTQCLCEDFFADSRSAMLPSNTLQQLPRVWAASPYVAGLCQRHPDWLQAFATDEGMLAVTNDEYADRVAERVSQAEDIPGLKRVLRDFRQQSMLRLAWRDIAGLDDLDATLTGLSALADALVDAALDWLQQRHAERHGQPQDAAGKPINLVVLGMGKLGGNELNFSSDIDLIFAYREAGQTKGPKPLSHEEYFRGLAQQLVQALNEHTEHGFVFRVDTRLRPFGESGPLVMHFDAMEQYYQVHGREWERYAWIKARPIAGNLRDGLILLDALRPFVYRRYLDYSAYDSLREMKAMIERETVRKGMEANIKLGRGGIREVEFLAQVYQLIRGGQDRDLQARGLREVLSLLAERDLLPREAVTELDAGYVFLRRLENRLQAYADRQTHDLPKDAGQRAAVAVAMGYPDWPSLAAKTQAIRDVVYGHFQSVFGQDEDEVEPIKDDLAELWLGHLETAEAVATLARVGFVEAENRLAALRALRESARFSNLGETSRHRVDECVPLLILSLIHI